MKYLITISLIFSLFALWMLINTLSQKFSKKHPELGEFREEGGGCGKSCGCDGKSKCKNKNNIQKEPI